VYFLLIAVNFYELTATLFESISEGYTPPDPDEIRFDVWSYQWAGIVAMLLLYPLLFVKKIEVLLRFLTFTIYLVLIYLLYILTFAVFNMVNGDIQWGKYTLFSPSFSKVAGAFALSFIVHPVISPYLKKNLNQDKNGRDLFFGYVATAFIYSFVGIFGSFACGKVVEEAEDFSTIFQCFQRSSTESWVFWVSKVVQSFILLQNLSAFPIIWFMTRKQFLEVLDKNHPSDRWHLASTVSIIVVSLAVQVFNIPVSAVVSFDGAVVGFVLVYLIPVYMHWKCMYHSYSEEENTQRRIDIEKELSTDNAGLSVSLVDDDESLKCVDHPPKNKRRDMFLYSAIMVFGVAMGIFKILSFITGK
jgi:sodium-coupled neutral amino acid transporter 9